MIASTALMLKEVWYDKKFDVFHWIKIEKDLVLIFRIWMKIK